MSMLILVTDAGLYQSVLFLLWSADTVHSSRQENNMSPKSRKEHERMWKLNAAT